MNIQPSNNSVLEPESRRKAVEAVKLNDFERFKENADKISNLRFDSNFLVRFCISHRRSKMLAYILTNIELDTNAKVFPSHFTPDFVSEIKNHIRLFKLEKLNS
jgi:hypothetical protein